MKPTLSASSNWWSTSTSARTVKTMSASNQIPPWRSTWRGGGPCSLSLRLSRSTTKPICPTENSSGRHGLVTGRVGRSVRYS
jgi:hypothetical protein